MSTGNGADPAICSHPIDAAILADYWLAALGSSEEQSVEDHLLECHRCGARLGAMIALAEALRRLARAGSLRMVVSETFVHHVAEDGSRIRQYSLPSGGVVQCTVTADDDILIGRLAAALTEAKRVDLSICDERGAEKLRLRDIPVHSEASSAVYQESLNLIKAAPSSKIIARMLAVDEAGDEHLLGEYTFNHTRSMPGPGAC